MGKRDRKAYCAEYYVRNREKIKAYSAEYYAQNKEGIKAQQAEYRAQNRERIKARKAEHYAQNKERMKTQCAEYRAKNKEKVQAYMIEYYDKNRDMRKAYQKQYRRNHLEKHALRQATRRARLANTEITLTEEQWQIIKNMFKQKCVYCGKRTRRLTKDHIIPLSQGGGLTLSNIVPACRSCNSKKRTSSPLKPIQVMLL